MSDDGRYDQFADVIGEWDGSLGGDALGDFDGVKAAPTPAGMVFEMRCEFCGVPQQITVPWGAIVALKYGVSPHVMATVPQLRAFADEKWGIDNNLWAPVDTAPCRKCGTRMGGCARLRIAMHEPEKFLQAARMQRWFPHETDFARVCAGLAQRASGR